ncbi:hypothetical protein KIPB_003387 [Kipferlia bialata]|uniref:Uncharacterized protein n=1 Tax=Kipferlia bialata TaxID=797122 RepID=A0A9K3CTB6_9EUKA|nr:hypothetical protein KIPB_003387 [Kipferlia bialata]|eukprot:g3387.t1
MGFMTKSDWDVIREMGSLPREDVQGLSDNETVGLLRRYFLPCTRWITLAVREVAIRVGEDPEEALRTCGIQTEEGVSPTRRRLHPSKYK